MVQSKEIKRVADTLRDEIIAIRRTFHQYPELSWQEHKTAERVASLLRAEGLTVETGVCGPGLIAEIGGGGENTVAVRADMDALPMHDAKEVAYASKIAGVMHACGHDSHMAIAIGVAKLLKQLDGRLAGKIRFIFQPSEEATPSGAEKMVEAGAMDGVNQVFAFHVDPELPAGKIGLRSGVLTAHCNEFSVSILGRSGHAARPHQSIDTIFLSNQVLNSLYNIVGNRSEPFKPAVLSIGKVQGGTKANVIPERVDICGTVRTIDDQTRNEILKAIEDRVASITRASGGTYQLEFQPPVPSVVNDATSVNLIREVATSLLTADGIFEIKNISMGGEDFSWYLTKAKGALIRLGARKPGEEIRFLHTHNFDIDERALPVGVAVMAMLVLKCLS